jgi:uncharacterized protein (TIGR00299 family) protein
VSGDRHAWIDASAGIAGDMFLGALVDAGADLAAVRRAVEQVVPDAVRLSAATVTRAGLRALKVDVEVLVTDQPHRTWRDIRRLLADAALAAPVRDRATAVFAQLAAAEAHVHATLPEDVHFHEVGALDSIADVVGACAALVDLRVVSLSAGEVALGSGRVSTGHGDLPVPVPAVAELAKGRPVRSGGTGELTTPTGMALIRTLATAANMPAMVPDAVGVGAGTRDTAGRANVVRVLIGTLTPDESDSEPAMLLEANVDDLDPRLWPGVLDVLLRNGAADAWLTPIVMKKGRPAHTLSVLCAPQWAPALRELVVRETTTFGVREGPVRKYPLPRTFVEVNVSGRPIAIKVAHRGGVIVQVMPEFEDVAALARRLGQPPRVVLHTAAAVAAEAGLVVGASLPDGARDDQRLTAPTQP